MSNWINSTLFRRLCSALLVLVLLVSVCPISVFGQNVHTKVEIDINGDSYDVEMQFVDDVLHCRADQWAQVAACLWKHNTTQKQLYFYYDTPVILDKYAENEYFLDKDVPWIPFFEVAKQTGVCFSEVKDGTIYGYRIKPLAVFYEDMDRMFGISKYRITELILSLGGIWKASSAVSRGYAILSSMSIGGFVDAVSGKMDQELYDDAFIEMLKTDETLLGTVAEAGDTITRLGKFINILQKSIDEDGALIELLKKLGHSESEIHDFIWAASQVVYGEKVLNDVSDLYEIDKITDFVDILKIFDKLFVSIEADAHAVMAMQEVFADSDSGRIRYAVQKAIGARTSKTAAIGVYTFEYIEEYLLDKAIEELADTYYDVKNIGSLEKLVAKAAVWVYDKTLSLSNKSNAIMSSEVYSQIQLELASYYYDHCDDDTPENGIMMHSVALLYLRACLAAYKSYDFFDLFDIDNSMAQSIDNATSTIKAEIKNLMTYTEEELLQNGTSEECQKEILALVNKQSNEVITPTTEPVQETTAPTEVVPVEPVQKGLFDGRCWMWAEGPTLAAQNVVRFYSDGTYEGYNLGSGMYINGTYSYSAGELTLNGEKYLIAPEEDVFAHAGGGDICIWPGGEEMWDQFADVDGAKEPWEEGFVKPEPPEEMFGVWYNYTASDGVETAWCISFDKDGTFIASCGEPYSDFFYEYISGSWYYVYEVEDYTFSITTEDPDLGGVTIRLTFDGDSMYVFAETDSAWELPVCFEIDYQKEYDY